MSQDGERSRQAAEALAAEGEVGRDAIVLVAGVDDLRVQPIADDAQEILNHVSMGKAVVDRNICNSFNGYVCGVCVFACPYDGMAIFAEAWEQPVVTDKCVGCGLCEQACIHYPQAIRARELRRRKSPASPPTR